MGLVAGRSARPRTLRRASWGLMVLVGVACSQMLTRGESPSSVASGQPHAGLSEGAGELAAFHDEGSGRGVTGDSTASAPEVAPAPAVERAAEADLEAPANAGAVAVEAPALEPISPPDWRAAVNAADWKAVAGAIAALDPAEQSEPSVRYARAIAARELGQFDLALECLQGLEEQLPVLGDEIEKARAQCQMEVGPYDSAVRYFKELKSPEGLIAAAQALYNADKTDAARHEIERAFKRIREQGRETRRGRRNEIRARELRARIAEAQGQKTRAGRDLRWLAVSAPTDERALDADREYERVSGEKLSKSQRLERALAFSGEGLLEPVRRELALMESAPGPDPDEVSVKSALAFAYYRSRSDYERAAELFREASELSPEGRVKHRFFSARALSRAHFDDEAIVEYGRLAKEYPRTGFAERAVFRIARLHYGLGRWGQAEKAYDAYLEQYPGGRFVSSSRYERAISQLGGKHRANEAAKTLHELARRARRPHREALLSHLEGVAWETAGSPKDMLRAIKSYRGVIEKKPVSFAAMASAARLARLGHPDVHRSRLVTDLGEIDVAPDPSELANVELPQKAKLLAEIGLRTDAEAALFRDRNVVKQRYSNRQGQALCSLYQSLDRGYRSYSLAYTLLRSERLAGAPSGDNAWAWRCAFPKPYRELVEDVEARYELPEKLVYAVMRQESAFRPDVVSPVGAVGLMQLMPYTARKVARDITQRPGAPWVPDPELPKNILNNLEMGGFYLSKLMGMMKDQMPLAVASYNAGPKAVSRWLAGGEDLPIDVWVGRIPYKETRHYVAKVMGSWLAYRYLDDPDQLPVLDLDIVPGTRATPEAY